MSTLTRSKLGWKIGGVRRVPRTDPQPTLSRSHLTWPLVVELEGVDHDDVDTALAWVEANLGTVTLSEWMPADPVEPHDCPYCMCDEYDEDSAMLFMHVRVLGPADEKAAVAAVKRAPIPETRGEAGA